MAVTNNRELSFVTFNMHGFNQGWTTVRDLSMKNNPEIFLLQEHWLLPSNIQLFEQTFPDYFCFGSSAMGHQTESGILSGRPFGGTAFLIQKRLQKFTKTIVAADRFCVVKVFDFLLVNVYFPCAGTTDRMLIIDDTLCDITAIFDEYHDCKVLLGGDLNCDLDCPSETANLINSFCADYCLNRCDIIAHCPFATYVNTALNCSSHVDYFLVSDSSCFVHVLPLTILRMPSHRLLLASLFLDGIMVIRNPIIY